MLRHSLRPLSLFVLAWFISAPSAVRAAPRIRLGAVDIVSADGSSIRRLDATRQVSLVMIPDAFDFEVRVRNATHRTAVLFDLDGRKIRRRRSPYLMTDGTGISLAEGGHLLTIVLFERRKVLFKRSFPFRIEERVAATPTPPGRHPATATPTPRAPSTPTATATATATPTPTPTSTRPPLPSDRPGPTNTGPQNEALLAPSGDIRVTQNGAVIENVFVTGSIVVRASNVTIRNFRINSNSYYGVKIESGTGTVIEDGEIFGMSSAAVIGDGWTGRRLHVHDSGGDGFKAGSNVVLEDSYVHSLGTSEGAHADGIQISSGSNDIIRRNNFDMPVNEAGYQSNAAVFLKPDFGAIDNVLVDSNWMNGGNYTIYVTWNGSTVCTNVTVSNNRFGRDYRYGTSIIRGDSNVFVGNVWDDNGQPLP